MGNDKRISLEGMEEQARAGLAKERDAAIERYNMAVKGFKSLSRQYQQVQQDMVRWMLTFMLLNNLHEITVDTGTLKKSDGYVLRRRNDPEAQTVTWDCVTKEQAEEEQAERKLAQAAAEVDVKLAAEVENVEKVIEVIDEAEVKEILDCEDAEVDEILAEEEGRDDRLRIVETDEGAD